MPDERQDNTSLLQVEGLQVTYRSPEGLPFVAVDGVGFSIGRGERVALVGESGSGKTATCLAVAGFLTQTNVKVQARNLVFDGRPLKRTDLPRIPTRTDGMAMVFQDAMTSLDPVWTIGSQLRTVVKPTMKGKSRAEVADRCREWLNRVGLTDTARVMKSRPYELSGGMRQRVMMALALSGSPKLLIADEPTSALDASLSRDMMELMVELAESLGTSLLLVSHDLHLCQEYADRTMVMYGGRIVEAGSAAVLQSDARQPYTRALLKSVPTLENRNAKRLPTIPLPATRSEVDVEGQCVFRKRCPQAHDRCTVMPPQTTVADGHVVSCWLEVDETAAPDRELVAATAGSENP
jgi:oligopeptide/dipeptide ABC transporter ATP-binding protein